MQAIAPTGLARIRQAESRGQEAIKDAPVASQEIMKGELKQLQEDFSRWNEELGELCETVDKLALQWQSYEANIAEFNNWLNDAEIRMKSDIEAKGFGPDKTLLEVYKVCMLSCPCYK